VPWPINLNPVLGSADRPGVSTYEPPRILHGCSLRDVKRAVGFCRMNFPHRPFTARNFWLCLFGNREIGQRVLPCSCECRSPRIYIWVLNHSGEYSKHARKRGRERIVSRQRLWGFTTWVKPLSWKSLIKRSCLFKTLTLLIQIEERHDPSYNSCISRWSGGEKFGRGFSFPSCPHSLGLL